MFSRIGDRFGIDTHMLAVELGAGELAWEEICDEGGVQVYLECSDSQRRDSKFLDEKFQLARALTPCLAC
jgi:hypothetical protein